MREESQPPIWRATVAVTCVLAIGGCRAAADPNLVAFSERVEAAVRDLRPGEETRVEVPGLDDNEWLIVLNGRYLGTVQSIEGIPQDVLRKMNHAVANAFPVMHLFLVRDDAIVGRSKLGIYDVQTRGFDALVARSVHQWAVLGCERRDRPVSADRNYWNETCVGILESFEPARDDEARGG